MSRAGLCSVGAGNTEYMSDAVHLGSMGGQKDGERNGSFGHAEDISELVNVAT
jgi:hypothetical protein